METERDDGGQETIDIGNDVFGPGIHSVLGFLQPYQPFAAPDPNDRGMILVERRRRTKGTTIDAREPDTGDNIRRLVRDWMWEWGAHDAPTAITKLAEALQAQHQVPEVMRVLAETLQSYRRSIAEAILPEPLKSGVPGLLQFPPVDFSQQLLALSGLSAPGSMSSLAKGVLESLFPLIPPPLRPESPERPGWLLNLLDLLPGVLLALGEYRSYRSDSLIRFVRKRETFFDFTFWAFPQTKWKSIIPKYLKFCWNFEQARGGFRPTLFTEVYFIGQDQKSLLSFSSGGPIFTLDIVDSRAGDDVWRDMNHAYNEWAAGEDSPYGPRLEKVEIGRPLLNQTKHLVTTNNASALVRIAFGAANWAQFSKAVWEANPPYDDCPNGRFVNAFFARILYERHTEAS